MAQKRLSADAWKKALDSIAPVAASGDIVYHKFAKAKYRLVLPSYLELPEFYAETVKNYNGEITPAYLIPALIQAVEPADPKVVPSKTKVKYIRVPITVVRFITGLCVDEHELFDPVDGHGIIVTKLVGETTTYTVTNSPKPVPVDYDKLEWPEEDIYAAAAAEVKRVEDRNARKNGGARSTGRRNVPVELEDDEDLPF